MDSLRKRGEVISAERLFELVWGEKYYTNSTNTIMVHIMSFKRKNERFCRKS